MVLVYCVPSAPTIAREDYSPYLLFAILTSLRHVPGCRDSDACPFCQAISPFVLTLC